MIVGLEDNERVGVDETTVLHAPHFEHQTYRIRLLARVTQNIQSAHRPPRSSFSSFAIDWRMSSRSPSSFRLNRMRRMLSPS